MKRSRPPANVSVELASLEHGTKHNRKLPKLPANTIISKRPIIHGPIASPFAGSNVQKVIYVSRKTPVISAVKRVKKFLDEIEKRALQSQGVGNVLERAGSRPSRGRDDELQSRLEDASDKLRRDAEEVLVKASGRAMEQALRIGEWFKTREKDILTNVEVRTGNVSVIDDLIEHDNDGGDDESRDEAGEDAKENMDATTVLEGGDTTMELLGSLDSDPYSKQRSEQLPAEPVNAISNDNSGEGPIPEPTKKGRHKRKRKEYSLDELPEARIRWVKTVEIAISLRA